MLLAKRNSFNHLSTNAQNKMSRPAVLNADIKNEAAGPEFVATSLKKIEELAKVMPAREFAQFAEAHRIAKSLKEKRADSQSLISQFSEKLKVMTKDERDKVCEYLVHGAGVGAGIFDIARNNKDHETFYLLMDQGIKPDIRQWARAVNSGDFDYRQRLKLIKYSKENHKAEDLEAAKDGVITTGLLAKGVRLRDGFKCDEETSKFYSECKSKAEEPKLTTEEFDPTKRTTPPSSLKKFEGTGPASASPVVGRRAFVLGAE